MAVAPIVGLAATGFSMAGTLMGAQGKADAAQAQSDQAERAAEIGKVKAAQTDTSMRQSLAASLANISAVRASANTSIQSPTGMAIEANVEGKGDQNRTTAVDNINDQVASDQAAASFYHQSAENAITGGYLGAAGGLFSGLSGGLKSGGFLSGITGGI